MKKKEVVVEPKRGRLFGRLFRVFLVLAVLVVVGLAVGSVFVRAEVIRLVRDRTQSASSLVMSAPTALGRGTLFEQNHFLNRLERLNYLKVAGRPNQAGEFNWTGRTLLLSLRGGKYGEGIEQAPLTVRMVLADDGTIASIKEDGTGRDLDRAYLEPEALSRLSDSASRASVPKRLNEYPQLLIDAIISIEDERFYSHFGIDPIGIARAIFTNLTSGRLRQGGSTLTQQLAKNLFLSPERSMARKGKEALAAVCLETAFSKDQILELYMNEVFLGQEGNVAIHGFGEAARAFFGKDVRELSLSEAATLAGLSKAPTSYSPRLNPDAAAERRNIVLAKMAELGKITSQEKGAAEKEALAVRPAERARRIAPYFVDFVRGQVSQIIDNSHWEDAPLRIVTGIDLEYQMCAETAVTKGLKQLETKYPRLTKGAKPLQGAFIAVNPVHGDILAWVGGRDYSQNQFDRISQSKRQPGSTFKPFVYLTGLDRNLNSYRVARTTTILMDEPVEYEIPGSTTWQPKNYDNRFRGPVTVRDALTHSLNVPTVELAQKVGIDAVARTAALFGFGENLPHVPSLALGAGEVSPLGLARAYSALANGGVLLNLVPIESIVEADTRSVLYAPPSVESPGALSSGLPPAKGVVNPNAGPAGERVASEAAVYVLTTILRNVIEEGTARSIRQLGYQAPAAGKTGTSNDTRDAWFAGFTPHLLGVVWIGFDDNKELKLTGGQAAAPIWAEFMKCVQPLEPQLDFVAPPGVVFRDVDRTTGLLFTSACNPSDRLTEVFVEGTEPVTACNHGGGFDSDSPYSAGRPADSSDDEYPPLPASEGGTDQNQYISPPSRLPAAQTGDRLPPAEDLRRMDEEGAFVPRGRPYLRNN